MSLTLIQTINQADALAKLWREGRMCALLAVEAIVALGFYAVAVTDRGIVGYYLGVMFEL